MLSGILISVECLRHWGLARRRRTGRRSEKLYGREVSHHAATYLEQNEFGTKYEVVLPIRGPIDKEAPASLPMWNF